MTSPTPHSPITRLCLLDPELKDTQGHFFEFASSLGQAARDAELETLTFGNRDIRPDLAARLDVVPAFDGMSEHFIPERFGGKPLNPLIGGIRFLQALKLRLEPIVRPNWLVLAASANHRHYWALGRWYERFSSDEAPALALMLRYSYFDIGRDAWQPMIYLVRPGLRQLERAAYGRRLRLIADSHRLAAEFGRLTDLPIEVLPIPHMLPDGFSPIHRSKPRRVRFLVPSEARHEKGFDVFVEALDRLRRRDDLNGMEFVIQCYIREHLGNEMAEPRRKLLAMNLPNARVIVEPLDTPEYYRLLAETDVVVLPYRRYAYYVRSSGICAEALAAGKPLVTTRDTWLTEQFAEGGAGVFCDDGDPDDLVRALVEARDTYPDLARQARETQSAWIAEHSMDRFLERLMGIFV